MKGVQGGSQKGHLLQLPGWVPAELENLAGLLVGCHLATRAKESACERSAGPLCECGEDMNLNLLSWRERGQPQGAGGGGTAGRPHVIRERLHQR